MHQRHRPCTNCHSVLEDGACDTFYAPTHTIRYLEHQRSSLIRHVQYITGYDSFLVKSRDGETISKHSWMSEGYTTLYKQSIEDPDRFWGRMAEEFLVWDTPFGKVMDCNMEEGIIRWFTGGKLNVSGEDICESACWGLCYAACTLCYVIDYR